MAGSDQFQQLEAIETTPQKACWAGEVKAPEVKAYGRVPVPLRFDH